MTEWLQDHEAVSLTAIVGSHMNDGIYGLCSCGFLGYVVQNESMPTTMANELRTHIASELAKRNAR